MAVGVAEAHGQRVAIVMAGTRVRLRITVFNASGLRAADWNGKSDPYVLGEIVGKPHTQFRTKTIERTLDPEWDEEKIVDDFEVGDELELKVMDEDNKIKQAFAGDDFLGSYILTTEEIYPHGFTGELILSDDQGNGEDATLRLSIAVEHLPAPDLPPYGSTYGDPAALRRDLYADQQFAPPTATLPPGAFADDHPMPPTGTLPQMPPTGTLGEMPPTGTLPPSTFAGGHDDAPLDPPGQVSHTTSGPQVKRLRVVITSAEGLRNADWIGKSDPYCVCEVPGKPYTRFKTEVRSDTLEPVWNKQCDFDYTPGDPLEFSVFDKDIWPKSDDHLGRARLTAEHFYPNGFEGELPLDDQGSLHISVMLFGSGPGAAVHGHHTPQRSHTPPQPRSQAHQARTPPRAEPRAPLMEPWSSDAHRLRITLVSARGVSLADGGTRCDLCCACEVPRRAGSGFRTRIASAGSGNPVWNHEQEIQEYFPGESLEFVILNGAHAGGYLYAGGSEGDIVGSCTLNSDQFFPFGFDAELTIFSPGQGIRGLLRVKVNVLDGPGMETRGHHLPTRSVGSSLTTDIYRVSTRGNNSTAEVLPITSAAARGTDLRPTSASVYAPRVVEPTKSQRLPLTSFSDVQVLHRGEETNTSPSRLVQPISSTVQSSGISAARVLPVSSSLGVSSGVAAMPARPVPSMVTQPASVTSVAAQASPLTTTLRSTGLTTATSVPMNSLSSSTSAAIAVVRTPQPVGSLSNLSNQTASSYVHQPRRPRTREEIFVSNPAAYSLPIAEQGVPMVAAGSVYSGSMGVYGASLGQETVPMNVSPMPKPSVPLRLL